MVSKFILERIQNKISNCPSCEELREELAFTREAMKQRDKKIKEELNLMIGKMWTNKDIYDDIERIIKLLED